MRISDWSADVFSSDLPGSTLSVSAPLVQDEVAVAATPAFPAAGVGIHFTSATESVVYDLDNPRADVSDSYADPDQVLYSGVVDGDKKTADELVFSGSMVKFGGVPTGGQYIGLRLDRS